MDAYTDLVTCITVPAYAARLGISPAQVRAWITSGELEAVNTAERIDGERPRWKISPEAIERFERRRSSLTRRQVEPAPRQVRPANVTQFV